MNKDRLEMEKLERALDAALADLDATSDSDLLAEMAEQDGGAAAISRRISATVESAISAVGRRKMAAAKAALRGAKENKGGNIISLSAERKRLLVERFAQTDPNLRGKLTMAARGGTPVDDREIDGILEDLIDLGLIDANGDPS